MWKVLILSFLLLAFAMQAVRADDNAPEPDFAGYPQTESFKYFVRAQVDNASHLQRGDLIAISAFPSGDRFALQYFVTESGQEHDERHVYNWAHQATRRQQLSKIEVENLRSAIRELPAKSVTPPQERLVIVSFRQGADWVTRSYDSDHLPKAMRQIYNNIGERFESKKKNDEMKPANESR